MTRLILMRHAKSSWKEPGQSDHQRPLNARGRRDAPAIARLLVQMGWTPELAVVSDAARTEETWAWMHGELGGEPTVQLASPLYHGALGEIIDVLRLQLNGEATVLALGHNPGWEDAVAALSGRHLRMKTANAALLSHSEPWEVALRRRDWRLDGLLTPPDRPMR